MFFMIQTRKYEHKIKAMNWLETKGYQAQGLGRILFPWWQPMKKLTYHDDADESYG